MVEKTFCDVLNDVAPGRYWKPGIAPASAVATQSVTLTREQFERLADIERRLWAEFKADKT